MIKSSRVPILKLQVDLGTPIACDISASNVESSFLMTKLFWTFNRFDPRVAPLVFVLRHWAKAFSITTEARPTPNITNYQLTMLILYYLMNLPEQAVLVHMDRFVTRQRVLRTVEEVEEFLRETVVMEPQALRAKFQLGNRMGLGELVRGFFEFYSAFEFDKRVISLAEKPVNAGVRWSNGLYVENPFDCCLNAAANVTVQKVSDLQNKCVRTLVVMRNLGQRLTLPLLMEEIERTRSVESKKKLPSISDVLTREMYDY